MDVQMSSWSSMNLQYTILKESIYLFILSLQQIKWKGVSTTETQ